MKRLSKILVVINVTIILIVTLFLFGLYFFLPKINEYRSQLQEHLQSLTGIPIKIGHIKSEWSVFMPILILSDFSAYTEKVSFNIKKLKFSFDIWRSLFSLNLQFHDIIFYQLNAIYYKPLKFVNQNDFSYFDLTILDKLFLNQFIYFKVKESNITFFTPSEEKKTLKIFDLTWLNQSKYHQAKGFLSFNGSEKQQQNQDFIYIKLNFHNKNNIINNGTIYLQANNINLIPWLSHWLRDSTGLKNLEFSFSSLITIKDNHIKNFRLQLHYGQVNWKFNKQEHHLIINNLLLILNHKENGWLFNIKQLQHLKTNQQQWLEGQISLFYLPESKINKNHWRIRANNIELEKIRSILSIFSFFMPEFISDWQKRQIKGQLIALAIDITPDELEKSVIDITWKDISWISWKNLPSINHFSGALYSSKEGGIFSFNLNNSFIENSAMFKVPLEISVGNGIIFWLEKDNLRQIWSKNLDLQAKSLWITGDFRYILPKNKSPTLSVLVGAKLTDAGDLWRYFPINLMSKNLIDYLTKAIIAGHIDEATIIFHGDPANFPFKKNNGQFQVFAPMRNAIFKYQPNWPTIFNLDVNLNFERNGLWISAPNVKLGDVKVSNLNADIIDYNQSKLLIKSDIIGDARAISNYFNKSIMKSSIGKVLDTIKITGNITGKLMLNIPLKKNNHNIIASGQIDLHNNNINITIINSQIKKITGRFYFCNGDLKSEKLQANWFGQPINLTFNTINKKRIYQININLNGNLQLNKIIYLPKLIRHYLTGSTIWKGKINIKIHKKLKKNPTLYITFNSKLNQLFSKLPVLDTKKIKQLSDIQIHAIGDIYKLKIYGDLGKKLSFNTQWQFSEKQTRLLRVAVFPYRQESILLPNNKLVMINLPEINDPKWFSLLALFFSLNLTSQNYDKSFIIPNIAIINLPKITFAKQQWNKTVFIINKNSKLIKITIINDNLKGSISIPKKDNLQIKIDYLYFNPKISLQQKNYIETNNILQKYNFIAWKNMDIYCSECWFSGYKLGEFKAQIIRNKQTFILKNGSLVKNAINLKIFGMWDINQKNSTMIKGTLKGNRFNDLTIYYNILIPIKQAPFKINFNLNWSRAPWELNIASLNGNLRFNLDNGGIAHMGGGNSGKLLRFISFDALLRKLQLDFSDIFSDDFLFDSIRGNITIKNGILNIKNFYIDGLIADIKIYGKINLIHRNMNLEAIITPEILTTVSIATAFVVNPLAGAAVFAATKIFRSIWNKISIIRYQITGSLEQPKINEVLREFKKESTK
ncbi:MAG: YhdP family protein [Arsenophonus sp. ET-DL12-MAG3]